MHRVLARTRAPRDAKPARCRLTIASADKDIYKGDHPAKYAASNCYKFGSRAEAAPTRCVTGRRTGHNAALAPPQSVHAWLVAALPLMGQAKN